MAEDQPASLSERKLDFNDETLRAIAQVYFEDGNNEYKKNEAYNAINFYTEGIQVNCKDNKLNAKLHSNRATVYLSLGNYQETLNDATAAVELEPTYVRAIERGAYACVQLKRYKEAMNWCEKGFAIDENNKTLQDLWKRCFCESNTSREAKPQPNTSMHGTHNVKGQRIKEELSYGSLGNAYLNLGDFYTAIDCYERNLKFAKEVGDRAEEGTTYGNLGNAYRNLGNFKTAIDYHKRHLKIAKEIGDEAGEGRAYGNLGNAHCNLGFIKAAIDYHERHLKVAKELGDKAVEGKVYGNLGNAYYSLGDIKTAIDYYERDLKFAKEVEDEAGEGRAYGNLGGAYASLGYLKTAIDFLNRHLRIAKEVGDKAGEGRAYNNLANTYQRLGDLKTAIDYYEHDLKIVKEIGDRAGEGTAYGNLGNAYGSLGDFKTAIDYQKCGLKLTKEVGAKAEEGRAYASLGVAYRNLGDYKSAVEYHERHLKIAKEIGDKAQEGNAYCNLGNVSYGLGNFKTAIDHYEHSLKLAKEVGDKVREGNTYGNLGNTYYCLGDFKTAIDYHERHLRITKEVGNRAEEGSAYCNLGNAYDSLGDFKTAIGYYERHLHIAKAVGDRAGEGKAYGNLGSVYASLEIFKSAIDYLECDLTFAKEVGDKAEEGLAYASLGNVYRNLGDDKTAIGYHERHLKIVTDVGDKAGEGKAYFNLGNDYYGLEDFEKAINYYERGLILAREVGDKALVATSFYCLGRSFKAKGSLPRALEFLQSSVRMFNDVRHHLQFQDEWKISYRDMHKEVYTSLWRLLLKQGKCFEALLAAEQGRAQALNDLMELNYGFDAASFCSCAQGESPNDSFRYVPSSTVFIANDEQAIVFWVVQSEKDVEMRRKEFNDNGSYDLDDLFQSLNETTSDEIGVRAGVKCENRSLDKLEDGKPPNEKSPQAWANSIPLHTTALRKFYDIIIDPIADLVQGNELVLVPEGALCLAPYAVFVDPDSRFLCESFRIRVIPSLTSLKLIADCHDGYHSKTGVLLVGDPLVQEVVYQGTKLEQLPCAREEVEMIGRILNSAPLVGREATKEEVLKRISSVALVHIAAHGRMDTGEIALTPNSTTRISQIPGKEDFLLTMRDVMRVQIRARLVVLSCCHSGRGEIKAEGVVGIARAFLAAGARSVLVSLWAIDDEATMEFMKCFYSHLMKGNSASESLNLTMKCMRESERFHEVKYWAPFVLIGDDVTLNFDGSD